MEAAPEDGRREADAVRDRLRAWEQRHEAFEYVERSPQVFGVSGSHRSIQLTAQASMNASDSYLTVDVWGGRLLPANPRRDASQDPTREDRARFSCCRNDAGQVGWRDMASGTFLTSEALADRYLGRLLTE